MRLILQKLNQFLQKIKVPSRITILILGFASTAWFLIRVIPKPSRAAYPCMKAAAPLASSFITYLIGITSFTFLFRKARERLMQSKYLVSGIFLVLGLTAGIVSVVSNNNTIWAAAVMQGLQTPNEVMGEAKGINPGRVVWVHDEDATNENCTNNAGDYWFMDKNTNTDLVCKMLSDGIKKLTGTSSEADAWDSIFHYYNINNGRGDAGYIAGEKVVIKINMNGIWNGSSAINTSPQVCYALLDQLVNVVGVAEEDIHIGDPNCSMTIDTYNKLHAEFSNVKYWGNGGGLTSNVPSVDRVLKYSDKVEEHKIPQPYIDATYMFNVPVFKKHHRAGISICSKNHFGSLCGETAEMHYTLPVPDAHESGGDPNGDYGSYRCFVDIMGHEHLGGKTVLYLVDGIWGSYNWGHPPIKFRMAPFGDGTTVENGDYPNSLFLSQDPVAIESVCYDFLYNEFDEDHPTEGLAQMSTDHGCFPRFQGTDDFLHQAADPANWPAGIEYDPEGDGSILTSLGVHEHWNNPIDKEYTRNLETGDGIELVLLEAVPLQLTPGNSGLLSEKVNVIHIDSFNVKWFGTDMGISRFDDMEWDTISTDSILVPGDKKDLPLLNKNVKDLAYERTSHGHEVWVATDSGMSVLAYNIDGVTSATTYHTGNSGILGNVVSHVGVDARHNRWVGTPNGVSIFSGGDWTDTIHFFDEQREWQLFSDVQITSMASYEKDSMIYITTDSAGVIRYQHDVDGFTGASAYGKDWSGLNSNTVNTVTVVDTSQWFGTPEGAYWHIGNEVKPLTLWDFFDIAALSSNGNVNAVELDNNDNVWFGTDSGLVIRTDAGWYKYENAEGIINPMVNDIKRDYSGNVWIATDGGVEYFSSVPGVEVTPTVPDQAANISVFDITRTSAKIAWTNGTGDYRSVFIKEGTNGVVLPLHGSYYLPDPEFGMGDERNGWYCIHNGYSSYVDTVTVTGLDPETGYRVMVCEYFNALGTEIYQTEAAAGNPANFETSPLGIPTIEKEQFSIYPVPFNDYIVVGVEFENADFSANIYSLDGKLQLQNKLTGMENEINTSTLPAGVYILQISVGNKSYSYKIVK